MQLTTLYGVILFTSLTLLLSQLLVKQKQTAHILFAIFCGSIAMMLTKKLSGDYLGAYQYLIGMGACATCNCYWLLSRSLFRKEKPISSHHLLLAVAIALLIMIQQGYLFISEIVLLNNEITKNVLSEITTLLSSCIIVLSFWEGCRGFHSDNKEQKAQRVLFLATFSLAIAISKVSQSTHFESAQTQEFITIFIIFFVLLNTHILLLWRFKQAASSEQSPIGSTNHSTAVITVKTKENHASSAIEKHLAQQVETLLIDQSLFLQANLKVADLARELNVPEYRVSKALRSTLQARNFNQYINELRIKYAKELLADPDKKSWPVLVVGLESGFASIGPFTRTFKTLTGFTPNQYRQQHLVQLA